MKTIQAKEDQSFGSLRHRLTKLELQKIQQSKQFWRIIANLPSRLNELPLDSRAMPKHLKDHSNEKFRTVRNNKGHCQYLELRSFERSSILLVMLADTGSAHSIFKQEKSWLLPYLYLKFLMQPLIRPSSSEELKNCKTSMSLTTRRCAVNDE